MRKDVESFPEFLTRLDVVYRLRTCRRLPPKLGLLFGSLQAQETAEYHRIVLGSSV
jgi:hypothetical protein